MGTIVDEINQEARVFLVKSKNKAKIVYMVELTLQLINTQLFNENVHHQPLMYGDYICGVKIVPTSYKQNDLTLE